MSAEIITGDCLDVLKTLPNESIHCCVTSPPYWGLRDYGIPPSIWGGDPACEHEWGDEISVNATNHTTKARWNHTRNGRDELQPTEKRVSWLRTEVKQGQFCQHCGAWAGAFGLEPTYQLYVEHSVEVFREVRRVMRPDATLWLNLGDSYCSGGRATWRSGASENKGQDVLNDMPRPAQPTDLKPKDLIGIPWRVAFALQADGWYLRQDIIWSKPNPMPESVTDRCTKAHEYLFLLSKSEQYYFDQEAILEPCSPNTHARLSQDAQSEIGSERTRQARTIKMPDGWDTGPGAHGSFHRDGREKGATRAAVARRGGGNRSHRGAEAYESGVEEHRTKGGLVAFSEKQRKLAAAGSGIKNNDSMDAALAIMPTQRNKRSVWTVATQPFKEAHFATFPPALIEPCILAGCPKGGTVLDPFGGAGTTGLVADRLQRDAILIELNPVYAEMARQRIKADAPLLQGYKDPADVPNVAVRPS